MKANICLGIDPGLSNTGWAIVQRNSTGHYAIIDCGCITTNKKQVEAKRVFQIYNHILEVLEQHAPDLLAVERVFFNQNPISCLSTAGVSYICMLAAQQAGVQTKVFTPQQVKSACGAGAKASKTAVKMFVSKLTKKLLNNSHISDAAATAIAGLLKIRTYQEKK